MVENRRNLRYRTLAKAIIEKVYEGETLLKDISITGCKIECTTYVDIKMNVQYILRIIPEKAAKIGEFGILVESKWIRSADYSCEIGFTIVESPKGKHFQRYVDYLDWRNSQGSSLTEDNEPETP